VLGPGASGEGAVEGELVGVFEAASCGEALSQSRDRDWFSAEHIDDVSTGGFSFDVGAEGKDDLLGRAVPDTFEERFNPEGIRTHVIQGGDPAAQTMVKAPECAGTFQGKDVGGLFDHAEQPGIAFRIAAYGAQGFTGKKAAAGTGHNGACGLEDGRG
jgi:hypothetical protein